VRSARGRRGLFQWRIARWRTEERGVERFGRLERAGGVVMRGGDVGGDLLGEVRVGLEGGQGGGFQVLVCVCICICIWQAWTLWVQGVLEERVGERTLTTIETSDALVA
jgi:hypothetical protein